MASRTRRQIIADKLKSAKGNLNNMIDYVAVVFEMTKDERPELAAQAQVIMEGAYMLKDILEKFEEEF